MSNPIADSVNYGLQKAAREWLEARQIAAAEQCDDRAAAYKRLADAEAALAQIARRL